VLLGPPIRPAPLKYLLQVSALVVGNPGKLGPPISAKPLTYLLQVSALVGGTPGTLKPAHQGHTIDLPAAG